MQMFSKTECARCKELDVGLREYLKTIPKETEEEPVKDPTPYMCDIHRALFLSRLSGRLIPFPLDYVLEHMELKPGDGDIEFYHADFPALEEKRVHVSRVPGSSDTFHINMEDRAFKVKTDVDLANGDYVFHEPWVLTHGYWVVESRHKVPPEALEIDQRYHAFPITYDEDAEKGIVQVYCERPHLSPDSKECGCRLTDVEPHHVVCPRCGVELKLWEYAVSIPSSAR